MRREVLATANTQHQGQRSYGKDELEPGSSSILESPIEYTAPKHVRDAIAALGRTEDVKFSPNDRRLAVASLHKNQIAIFALHISRSPPERSISITDVTEITSPYLMEPHGVDFLDNDQIIVANRRGHVTIFRLPVAGGRYDLVPLEVIRSGEILNTPANVSVIRNAAPVYNVLIGDTYGHKVTKHSIDVSEGCSIINNEILLSKYLYLPDGVTASGNWIAVSNHDDQNVVLYQDTGLLNELSTPDGILSYIRYPHGLSFTPDGRFILVADAGAPYVHIYKTDDTGWRGVHKPLKSVRILTEDDFLTGRISDSDGGPKGIDVDSATSTLVTTCHVQPLIFFNLTSIIAKVSRLDGNSNGLLDYEAGLDTDQRTWEMTCELHKMDRVADLINNRSMLINSRSWRYTAPLRWLLSNMKKLNIT